jgi:hypothetical protein
VLLVERPRLVGRTRDQSDLPSRRYADADLALRSAGAGQRL